MKCPWLPAVLLFVTVGVLPSKGQELLDVCYVARPDTYPPCQYEAECPEGYMCAHIDCRHEDPTVKYCVQECMPGEGLCGGRTRCSNINEQGFFCQPVRYDCKRQGCPEEGKIGRFGRFDARKHDEAMKRHKDLQQARNKVIDDAQAQGDDENTLDVGNDDEKLDRKWKKKRPLQDEQHVSRPDPMGRGRSSRREHNVWT